MAEAQDYVVACPFSFFAHRERGKPNQRMKPEQSASELCSNLGQIIIPAYMGKFVGKHPLELTAGPLLGFRRQKYIRTQPPAGEGDDDLSAGSKPDRARQAKRRADALEHGVCLRRLERQ